jgi:hypothetical protein
MGIIPATLTCRQERTDTMHRIAVIPIVLVSCFLCVATACAQWSGRIVAEDGRTRVVNPESPANGEIRIDMRPLWRIGGDDEDLLLGVIAELLTDDQGNIYLLDGQLSEVHVLDPAGQWLRSIGRAGEGPGEFRNGNAMFWAPDGQLGIIQAWPSKIVLLRVDGSPGDTFRLPPRRDGGMQFASRGAGHANRVILSGSAWTGLGGQQQQQISYLKTLDRRGNELVSFHETTQEARYGGWEFQEEQFVDFQRRWAAAPDGRVAAALDFAQYRIHVWNADGTLDRIIERPEHQVVRRTTEEKARLQTMFEQFTRWNPRSTFKTSDVHQAVVRLLFRDDGTLWVQTGRDQWRPEIGCFTSFDIHDREGRFMQKVHLIGQGNAIEDGIFVHGERLYVVTDMLNAMLARMGAGAAEEAEPVSVIAHALPLEGPYRDPTAAAARH